MQYNHNHHIVDNNNNHISPTSSSISSSLPSSTAYRSYQKGSSGISVESSSDEVIEEEQYLPDLLLHTPNNNHHFQRSISAISCEDNNSVASTGSNIVRRKVGGGTPSTILTHTNTDLQEQQPTTSGAYRHANNDSTLVYNNDKRRFVNHNNTNINNNNSGGFPSLFQLAKTTIMSSSSRLQLNRTSANIVTTESNTIHNNDSNNGIRHQNNSNIISEEERNQLLLIEEGEIVRSSSSRRRENQNDAYSSSTSSYRLPFLFVSLILVIIMINQFITITNDNDNNNTSFLSSITSSIFSFSKCKTSTTKTIESSYNNHQKEKELLLLNAISSDDDRDNDFIVTNMKNGMVASDQKICSDLGIQIMKEYNGNAIDAAITTALCIGVVNPSSSGLGGGGFMLIHTDDIHQVNIKNDNSNRKMPQYIDARDLTKTIVSKNGKITEVIDCREIAPNASYVEMYIDSKQPLSSVLGGLAIAVPGELRGLELAHSRYGILEWNIVVKPIVELLEKGIPVSKYLAHVIANTANNMKTKHVAIDGEDIQLVYKKIWGLRNFITHNNNWDTPLLQDDIMKNPILLQLFNDIMNHGSDALYTGTRAIELANDIQAVGGIITSNDIINYQPTIRTPIVSYNVDGFSIVGVPPPSSGGAVIIGAIRFLSNFLQPLSTFSDTLSMHRLVESMKHVFSIRMSLSDPNYNTNIVNDAVYDLVTGPYMNELHKEPYYYDNQTLSNVALYGGSKWSQLSYGEGSNITVTDAHEGDRRRNNKKKKQRRNMMEEQQEHENNNKYRILEKNRRELYRRFGYLNDYGTSHFSIVDKDGNAVSMTTSINTVFGSMVVSPTTGILLGNTMDDFANPGLQDHFGLKPSESNYIQPGKKPLSSMSPTLIFEHHEEKDDNNNNNEQQQKMNQLGSLFMAVGGSGGPKIITAVLQVIINHIWLGKTMLESMIHPRIHDQLIYHGASISMIEKTKLDHLITNTDGDILIELSQRTQDALISRNHILGIFDYSGCVQAITIDIEGNNSSHTLTGVSDIRKGGSPSGY